MSSNPELIITTAGLIQGYRIKEHLGVVRGTAEASAREPSSESSQTESRRGPDFSGRDRRDHWEKAYDKMKLHATTKGANAVIGVSYGSFPKIWGNEYVTATDVEIICYGTAVLIEQEG